MRTVIPKHYKVARTQQDVDRAQQLRFRAIAADLNISVEHDPRVARELSSVDNLETTHHVLLYAGDELVGTARLALPNAEIAALGRTTMGFEVEQELDLSPLSPLRDGLAEVARVCVLRPWRSTAAVLSLYEGLYCVSRELGVTHWIGAVDCQTSRRDEAEMMRDVLGRRGLVDERFYIGDAHDAPSARDEEQGAFYSASERERPRDAELRIASTLATFTRRLGARCIAPPVRHPAFPRYVMPMLVELDRMPESTVAKFDLSTLAPPARRPQPSFDRDESLMRDGTLVERMAS